MNNNIKVRKFVFNEKAPRIKFTDEERMKFLQGSKIVLQILEIQAQNPNDLILIVSTESMGNKSETATYLFWHRDKMLFQDGKYILRLDCVVDTTGTKFDLNMVTDNEKPFTVTAYYSVH